MDVLIAGGGTGGHLFPGIALAQELQKRDGSSRVLFVGSPKGIEARVIPTTDFDLELLPVFGLRKKDLNQTLRAMWNLPIALAKALSTVRRFKPEVAVSLGGYAAGPAVLAAHLLGVPCVVMEQNSTPGVTNRLLAKVARKIFTALPTSGFPVDKIAMLGNPVRQDLQAVREQPFSPASPPRVLVFGGSQGAKALNDVMPSVWKRLHDKGFRGTLTHQCGRDRKDGVDAAYGETEGVSVVEFIHDMGDAYANADLIVCRAGATTLAELGVCGRPSVLIPYPHAVDDHQTKNAQSFVEAGAAVMVSESELSADGLAETIFELVSTPQRLQNMAQAARELGRPQAAADIADALEQEIS